MKKNPIKLCQCRWCEILFYAPTQKRNIHFCSDRCRKESNAYKTRRWWRIGRKQDTHKCPICNKNFFNKRRKYCSPDCSLKGYRLRCHQSEIRRQRWRLYNGKTQTGSKQVIQEIKNIEKQAVVEIKKVPV